MTDRPKKKHKDTPSGDVYNKKIFALKTKSEKDHCIQTAHVVSVPHVPAEPTSSFFRAKSSGKRLKIEIFLSNKMAMFQSILLENSQDT